MKKQKGIILFTALIIILLLSLVVYGSLYSMQVTEQTGAIAGTNSNKTHQMAELALIAIETDIIEPNAAITPQCTVDDATSCKFTDAELNLINTGALNTFVTVSSGVSEDVATSVFSHIAYLGDSEDLEIAPGYQYSLYRITVVAVFGDARSALESVVALPVI